MSEPRLEGTYDAVVYGLGQMGVNIMDNMARNGGIRVIGVNRTVKKAHDVWGTIEERELTDRIGIADNLLEAVKHLKSPGGIIFPMIEAHDPMVRESGAIDDFFFKGSEAKYEDRVENMVPAVALAPVGTVFVDLANSHPASTFRRMQEFKSRGMGMYFLGTGVSGGSKGALEGPAIMPGGSEWAYQVVGPLLEKIAAHVGTEPCCAYMGSNEAGHFVKNVHNGVEYNIMGALAETYYILRELTGMSPKELQGVFTEWKDKGLGGYLLDITCEILGMVDPETGLPILDVILDEAGQKGTGKWTSQIAFDLGVPVEGITASLNERIHSGRKGLREAAAKIMSLPDPGKFKRDHLKDLIEYARDALYGTMIVAYAQGFAMFTQASKANPDDYDGRFNFILDLPTIANVWRDGCIVRAALLPKIGEAYTNDPNLDSLVLAPNITEILKKDDQRLVENWRRFVLHAVTYGLPRDAISASLSYLDNMRTDPSVAAMVQAQRDMFGEHGYGRIDKPGQGKDFHLPIERAYSVQHNVRGNA